MTTPTNNAAPETETREMKLGIQTRYMGLGATEADKGTTRDPSMLNADNRTLEIPMSSEAPVQRWYGDEILSHDAGAVDLSRLNDGAPLLFNHDWSDPIGVVESAKVEGGRMLATVRFSGSERGQAVMNDVKDGILRNVSIGYRVNKFLTDERDETYTAVDWQPYECTICTVPADASVGVGRSSDDDKRGVLVERTIQKTAEAETTRGIEMPEEIKVPAQPEIKVEDVRAQERERIAVITAYGEKFGMGELARQLIDGGRSTDEARAAIMEKLGATAKPVAANADVLEMSDKEKREYSVIRAAAAAVKGDWRKAGFEKEVSDELQKRTGRGETMGFYLPTSLNVDSGAAQRAADAAGIRSQYQVGTPASGGNLVATNLLAANFIDYLRAKARVMQLGATMLTGLVGNVSLPRQSGTGQVFWVAEGANVGEAEATFDLVSFSPKTVGAYSVITRQMMLQSTPDIEMLARNDLYQTMVLGIDNAAIQGQGASGQPLGILNMGGIGQVVGGANGSQISIDDLIDLETAVANANADEGSLAYLSNSKVVGYLKKLKSTTGQYLWTNNPMGQRSGTPGEINGYSFARSNQVPSNLTKGTSTDCSAVIYGNWSDLVIAEWGVMEILPNPYGTGFAAGSIQLRALQSVDINARHVASFAAKTDALTA